MSARRHRNIVDLAAARALRSLITSTGRVKAVEKSMLISERTARLLLAGYCWNTKHLSQAVMVWGTRFTERLFPAQTASKSIPEELDRRLTEIKNIITTAVQETHDYRLELFAQLRGNEDSTEYPKSSTQEDDNKNKNMDCDNSLIPTGSGGAIEHCVAAMASFISLCIFNT